MSDLPLAMVTIALSGLAQSALGALRVRIVSKAAAIVGERIVSVGRASCIVR